MYVLIRPVDRKEFEGRTFPHAYDVLVYQEGRHYYAKDARGNVICVDSPTSCIQEAINALTPNRTWKEKVLLKGVFVVKNIQLSSYTIIEGGKLILDPSVGANPAFIFMAPRTGVTDVEIRNVWFDGNERNITNTYTEGGGAPVHVGISLPNSKRVVIENNVFQDFAREAIWLTAASANSFGQFDIEDIMIYGNQFIDVAYGSTVEAARRISFINNIVTGLKSSGPGLSYFVSLNWLSIHDILIEGNIIDGVYSTYNTIGINNSGNVDLNNIVIKGNTFRNLTVRAIRSYNAVVEGNTIYGCGNGLDGQFGNSIIIGNTIKEIGYNCILIGADDLDPSNTVIANNYIQDCALSTTNNDIVGAIFDASRITSTKSNIKIMNNIIKQTVAGKLRFGVFAGYGTYDNLEVIDNIIVGDILFKIYPTTPATGMIIRRNIGYITENSGQATISANSTRVTVSHGLNIAPTKVLITPLVPPPGKLWVENITATSFDIVTDTAPTVDLKVAWYAEV